MKLTTKKLKELIKEELEQIQEVDDMPHGGSDAKYMDPNFVYKPCVGVLRGERPSDWQTNDKWQSMKNRCWDKIENDPRALAKYGDEARKKEAEWKKQSAEIDAKLKAEHPSSKLNRITANRPGMLDTEINNLLSSVEEGGDQYTPKGKHLFLTWIGTGSDIDKKKAGAQLKRIRNSKMIPDRKMHELFDYVGIDLIGKKYAISSETLKDIADYLESSPQKSKGFFGKLKSFVGLEESKTSITSEQLRQIVNEELKAVIKEKQKK